MALAAKVQGKVLGIPPRHAGKPGAGQRGLCPAHCRKARPRHGAPEEGHGLRRRRRRKSTIRASSPPSSGSRERRTSWSAIASFPGAPENLGEALGPKRRRGAQGRLQRCAEETTGPGRAPLARPAAAGPLAHSSRKLSARLPHVVTASCRMGPTGPVPVARSACGTAMWPRPSPRFDPRANSSAQACVNLSQCEKSCYDGAMARARRYPGGPPA